MGIEIPCKLNPASAANALVQAYVPEHIPALMAGISGGTPFQVNHYIGYTKDNWVIFIGYPLGEQFNAQICTSLLERVRDAFHPDYIWFIGPEIPATLKSSCRNRQSDHYFHLNLENFHPKPFLRRQVQRARERLQIQHSRSFDGEHQSLVKELERRQKLPPMIAGLYQSMPAYVGGCETARVLEARDENQKLSAFFVIETAANVFNTYLLGCHSKECYIPHASDLLFYEMIAMTRRQGKSVINLGLGVNAGIQRFKTKWGGKPVLKYEFCELYYGPSEQIAAMNLLLGKF